MRKVQPGGGLCRTLAFFDRTGFGATGMGGIKATATGSDGDCERQELGHCARQGVVLGCSKWEATEWPALAATSAQGLTAGSGTP